MSLTESDKVVLTKYPALPATCVVCLRSANGVLNFIDFQMSLDIYGSVNICTECLAPIAQLIGFVEKNLLDESEEIVVDLRENIAQLVLKNDELNATIDSLLSLRPDLTSGDLRTNEEPVKDSGEDKLQLDLGIEI